MEQTTPLRNILAEMAEIYNDGEQIDVEFTDGTPYAAEDGSHVAVKTDTKDAYGKTLDGAQEFRIIVDTLSHEVEHIRESNLTAKEEFAEEYPNHPKLAGTVLNVLEDVYIDRQRHQRNPGLRRAHAFKVDTIMQNGHRRKPLTSCRNRAEQVSEGFIQVAFAGYAKEIGQVDREVQAALSAVRPLIDRVRTTHTTDGRERIAHEVMDELLAVIPDGQDTDTIIDDMDMPGDQEPPEITADDLDDLEAADPGDVDPDDVQEVELGDDVDPSDLPDGDGQLTADADADALDDSDDQAGGSTDGSEGADTDAEPGQSDAGQTSSGEQTNTDTDEGGQSGGAGDESEADPQDGNDDTGDGADQDEPEVNEDELDEMEAQDQERESGSWHDCDDQDYHEPGKTMRKRYERLQEREQERETKVGQKQAERDERIDQGHRDTCPDHSDAIRDELRDSGMADEIAQVFRQFATRDRTKAAREGNRVNIRNAIQRVAGDHSVERLYNRKQLSEPGDRHVVVAADLSGSMSDDYNGSLFDLKVALGALHIATEQVGDDLTAIGFSTLDRGNITEHYPPGKDPHRRTHIDVITGPEEQFQWEHMDGISARSLTPTPDGIMTGLRMTDRKPASEQVIICLTDGRANIGLNSFDTACDKDDDECKEDAAKAVQHCRQRGVKVIGMGVGGGVEPDYMAEIFGADGYVMADHEDMADTLLRVYEGQMRWT